MWNGIHHVILNNQKLCALYINWNMFFKKGNIVSQMQCSYNHIERIILWLCPTTHLHNIPKLWVRCVS